MCLWACHSAPFIASREVATTGSVCYSACQVGMREIPGFPFAFPPTQSSLNNKTSLPLLPPLPTEQGTEHEERNIINKLLCEVLLWCYPALIMQYEEM